jgi:hypothetical protein
MLAAVKPAVRMTAEEKLRINLCMEDVEFLLGAMARIGLQTARL